MPVPRIINGTDGNDRLLGTGGPDLIDGSGGDDLLVGGNGDDILIGGAPVLQPGLESDEDRLIGGGGDDILSGRQGDDVLTGGSGRDVFTLGTANLDFLWDTAADYNGGGQDIVTDFQKGSDRIAVFIEMVGEGFRDDAKGTYISFDQLDLNGNGVLDAGDGPAVRIENVTHGGEAALSTVIHLGEDMRGVPVIGTLTGELVLHGVTGLEASDFIQGGTVSDGTFDNPQVPSYDARFVGGYDNDVIQGTAGNDFITDFGGENVIHAARGDDRVLGGLGADEIHGDAGDDLISGEDGNDLIFGGTGRDELHGFAGNDRLYGDAGSDRIYGGDDNDVLFGGVGNDFIDVGVGHDVAYGGAGNDRIKSSGSFYDDGYSAIMRGGAGDDELIGGVGTNRLFGDEGNDKLTSGSDETLMRGGTGGDWFIMPGTNGATVLDFGKGDDVLVLSSFRPEGEPVSFDDLDSNGDGILSGDDDLLSLESMTFNGVAKDSLVFLRQDYESSQYVPSISLWDVTELGRSEVAAA
ncbi:calcium-binding protein [Geminicoccus flavidas]|uniref:calcium-binding protein n=1 Tax=Geminicoccus flavidas TaxID=2506407 RepID=UPI0013587F3F|nr:calcium-binding protein [Geminicoccus flavidas]